MGSILSVKLIYYKSKGVDYITNDSFHRTVLVTEVNWTKH